MATSRSRSPVRDAHSRHRSPRDTLHKPTSTRLPLNARPLSKHDLAAYKSLFAVYLDVQKGIDIESLGDREVKGRWKSFVGRWYVQSHLQESR
ncbi:MAG: hypothetical protein INR71_00355 [Terriglobus roseus]|nr:hypothetical protein [Terriglobus roseus]